MTERFDNGIDGLHKDLLVSTKNRPMNYKSLCKELQLPQLAGNSKKKQLQQLGCLCELVVTQSPTRYEIKEVYPEAIQALEALNGNDKFQLMFEAVMYQALLNNGNRPLYLSSLDLLKLFCEVNENFAYACNIENMVKMGDEYFYMSNMGLTVYRILKGWTLDRLDRMQKRFIVEVNRGYRAYELCHTDDYTFERGFNAPKDSEIAKRCAKVCREAEEEWYNSTGMMRPEDKEKWCKAHNVKYNRRMPKSYYESIKILRRKYAKEEFKEENFVNVRPINIVSPPEQEWLKEKLNDIYRKFPTLESINEEACRKVLETTQLDELELTDEQKVKFVEINMKPNPGFSFKQELRRIKENEKENENGIR